MDRSDPPRAPWAPKTPPPTSLRNVKDSLRMGARNARPDQWARRFRQESAIGSPSFDAECAWMLADAWGPEAAWSAWLACVEPGPIPCKAAATWLMACARSGLPALPAGATFARFDAADFSKRLGEAAVRIGSEQGAARDPVLPEEALDDLWRCCALAKVPFQPAAESFARLSLSSGWTSSTRLAALRARPADGPEELLGHLREALLSSGARWEAAQMQGACQPGSPAAHPPRL